MTTATYSLDQFVYDMDQLVDGQVGQDKIFDKGSAYLERLVNSPGAIPEKFRTPTGRGSRPNHGTYLLHYGDNGLLITTVVWGPGDHLGPHDHRTWGMIGVIEESITETRFRRVDDREDENHAILEKDRETVVKPGDISLLIPDVDEIHQMDNYNNRSTVELHVYGHDLRGLERNSFSLETGQVKHFATTKFDNC